MPIKTFLLQNISYYFSKLNNLNVYSLVVGLNIFVLYLICMPQVVTLEDSGLFNMVCASAGVGHPPGYPLYSLLCVPFANLPFISTPLGVNILSAILGATTCSVMTLIVHHLIDSDKNTAIPTSIHSQYLSQEVNRKLVAAFAGLTLGVSNIFWSQSIIQEVYTLNIFLTLCCYLFAFRFEHQVKLLKEQFSHNCNNGYIADKNDESSNCGSNDQHICKLSFKNLYLCVLFLGLGISNHWPLTLLAAPALLLLLLPHSKVILGELTTKRFMWVLIIFILSLTPYLYLWLRSLYFFEINFYGPLDYWKRLQIYISRSGYAGVDSSSITNHRFYFLTWLFTQAKEQINSLGLFVSCIGMALSWRVLRWNISAALLWIFFSNSILLSQLLNFSFEPLYLSVFRVYPIPSWSILIIWFFIALMWFIDKIQHIKGTPYIIYVSLFIFVISNLGANWSYNYRRNDIWADEYAKILLDSFESNADIFVFDDSHLPMMYLHLIENYRPDLRIYNTQSLILGNRLFDIDTPMQYRSAIFTKHITNSKRATYYFNPMELPFGMEDHGYYFKVRLDLVNGTVVPVKNRTLDELISKLYLSIPPQSKLFWNQLSMEQAYLTPYLKQVKYTNSANKLTQQAANNVLRKNSHSFYGHHLLSAYYIVKQQWDKAIKHLYHSIESQPNAEDSLTNLVNALIVVNRKDEALELLKQKQQMWPSDKKQLMIKKVQQGVFVNQ